MANINMKAVSAILKAELALKDTSKPVEIQKEIAVLKLCRTFSESQAVRIVDQMIKELAPVKA